MSNQITQQSLSVSQLSGQILEAIQHGFPQLVWVEGEISGFRVWGRPIVKGWFFELKDSTTAIGSVCWSTDIAAIKSPPKEGEKVRALAKVTWNHKRGELKLNVKRMEPIGIGALLVAIEQRRQRLVADGLTENKRPIPRIPQRIAVVTASTSAAMADVQRILRQRWPLAAVRIYDSQVQGDVAPQQLVRALENAYAENWADVVLVVRGGGSLTDLMAFNDEAVCRTLARAPMPSITGSDTKQIPRWSIGCPIGMPVHPPMPPNWPRRIGRTSRTI